MANQMECLQDRAVEPGNKKRCNIVRVSEATQFVFLCQFYQDDQIMEDFLISNFRRVLYVVCFLLGNSPASEFYMTTFRNTLPVPSPYEYGVQRVPKRRHIKFRIREITQKKAYNNRRFGGQGLQHAWQGKPWSGGMMGKNINCYDNIKMDIKKCWRFGQDSYISSHKLASCCCENGNGLSGSTTRT